MLMKTEAILLAEALNSTNASISKLNPTGTFSNTECQNSNNTDSSKCGFNGTVSNTTDLVYLGVDKSKCNHTNDCKNPSASTIEKTNKVLLKYNHDKDKKGDGTLKNTGHPKNSLLRKKRASADPKLIVNYETLHSPDYEIKTPNNDVPINRLESLAGDFIQNSNLAHFNIKTLHDDVSRKNKPEGIPNNDEVFNNENNRKPDKDVTDTDDNDDSHENSSDEHPGRRNHRQEDHEDRSVEDENHSDDKENSESNEQSNYATQDSSSESKESYPEKISIMRPSSNLQSNRQEQSDSNERDSSEQSNQKSDDTESEEQYSNSFKKLNSQNSNENSEEHMEDARKTSEKVIDTDSQSRKISPSVIEDVDIGNLNYENIHSDENFKLGTNSNNPSAVEIIHPNLKPVTESIEENISSEKSNENYQRKPIHINDGDIRPVVEIKNDSEQTEEDNRETDKHGAENENVYSVENDSSEQSEKIVSKPKKIDPNQQFERIPLDYKHDNDKENKHESESYPIDSSVEADNENNEKLPPKKEIRYDENLNTRFSDVTVKLPDIKLPEDILAIPYDLPSDEEGNKEAPKDDTRELQNSNEDDHDDNKKPNDNHDDNDHHYYDQYTNNEKDLENHEDDDLYEKFVRERFGKKGTFQQRSARLQEARIRPVNSDLARQVQTVLKKTRKLHNEAKRSGDPNAGFMWTLEFGDQL